MVAATAASQMPSAWKLCSSSLRTAASQDVQQPPVGRAAVASVSFLSVLLLLWLLSPWTPSLYRMLLESASVAVASVSAER